MGYLRDSGILERVKEQSMITDFIEENLNPCTYDLRLGEAVKAYEPTNHPVRIGQKVGMETVSGETFIDPGEFLLATTVERVKIPNDLAAQVLGKSSVGRTGLFIHNAGHIDPGFEGEITLELFNAGTNPVVLRPGDRIAQLAFIKLEDGECATPYNGRYQNQTGATPSREAKNEG